MRVLHVETGRHLWGGARQAVALAAGMAKLGIDSCFVGTAGSAVAKVAQEAKLDVRAVPMGGDFDARFAWRLRRIIGEVRPDLVHVHSRRGADRFGAIAASMTRTPAVLSRRVDQREAGWPAKLKYARYGRVIAISACIEQQLLRAGVPRSKLRLVRSGVDPRACEPSWSVDEFRREFELEPHQPTIAVVAQYIRRKGHRLLIEALVALRDEWPMLRVACFGRGALREALVARSVDAGVAHMIRWSAERTDLREFLGHFSLLVHPALREGLGIALLEAQAAGIPVVAFRAGGVPEAVADGETGVLTPVGDSTALAQAIHRLLGDQKRRGELGAAARQRVARDFTLRDTVAGNLAVYQELVGG